MEYSTWARITDQSRDGGGGYGGGEADGAVGGGDSSSSRLGRQASVMPDLVTAQGSTLSVYRVEETTGKLLLVHSFTHLAGNVCYLETLRVDDDEDDGEGTEGGGTADDDHRGEDEGGDTGDEASATAEGAGRTGFKRTVRMRRPDALLIGFSGHPRLAIVHVRPRLLLATTLLDLTPALADASYGAVTPLEQELTASLLQRDGQHQATVSVVLGGGASVVCLHLKYGSLQGGWRAVEEPYVVPLSILAPSIDHHSSSSAAAAAAAAAAPFGSATAGGGHNQANAAASGGHNANKDATAQSIVTGFGEILGTAFLPDYLEPTVVILHSNPHVGRAWPGRLGRQEGGTRYSLVLTAVTVTVSHQRSAVLWSTEVPADAIEVHACPVADAANASPGGRGGGGGRRRTGAACLVQCVNSVVVVSNTGRVQQCLAVNGWVGSTLSAAYSGLVTANPWPFPRLAIQLDGAKFSPVNERAWFVVLRRGQVYLLQHTGTSGEWSLMALYQTVGAVGEVSHLGCWAVASCYSPASSLPTTKKGTKSLLFEDLPDKSGGAGKVTMPTMDVGLLFVGSRLGDSSLLAYVLDEASVADALRSDADLGSGQLPVKRENTLVAARDESGNTGKAAAAMGNAGADDDEDDAYERILQHEEDALYASTTEQGATPGRDGSASPDLVPPSDDEDIFAAQEEERFGVHSKRKRARLSYLMVVRRLSVLDSLTSLGPLGPACSGPLSPSPEVILDPTISMANAAPVLGTTGYIFPCGYGSSGGLALLSVPGRDDRTILAEADCINAKALFSLPSRGLVLLVMSPDDGGTRPLKLQGATSTTNAGAEYDLVELNLAEWCPNEDAQDFFTSCHLLVAADLTKDSFVMLVASPDDENSNSYFLVVLQDESGTVRMTAAKQLNIAEGESITSAKAAEVTELQQVYMAITLTSGGGQVIVVASDGSIDILQSFEKEVEMDTDDKDDEERCDEERFYADKSIVALDLFRAPKAFFVAEASNDVSVSNMKKNPTTQNVSQNEADYVLDEDDKDLYRGVYLPNETFAAKAERKAEDPCSPDREDAWYVAVCRQTGDLEIYIITATSCKLVWSCKGCGHGQLTLQSGDTAGLAHRSPRAHKVYTRDMSFFFCGPSASEWRSSFTGPRPFCLIIETSDGDSIVYVAEIHYRTLKLQSFERLPLKDVSRPSQESTKHFSKLRRKRIVSAKDEAEPATEFRYSRLFSFENISGQDGVFASVARPFWLIAERGRPTLLYHRCRHAAPAGARQRPVAGFCSGLSMKHRKRVGFVTLHERVGRVGSQRMTLFDGVLNLADQHSLLAGGGIFVQKVPFGVTVRSIQFIDDSHATTGTRPLYAVLVSREFESDLSELNYDGLTEEERQYLVDEKENEKIQRQVEADLGGFDVEQEWVEEIEREDCFKVDTDLGGAPPIQKSAYSLWIVDVANGWQVVDSYELEEAEYGITMQVMSLSEFLAEPGSNVEVSEDDLDMKHFIAVGTGIVDKDGEDVASKGRALLFEVNRSKDTSSLQIAELNFVYEKAIFHGPVTSLTCLISEGKNRLIIGAGADVNVEQWGNDKLTQVGFFRATMHIRDIKLFKNFFILSDAYDSMYFLVWRESDKSLTLLAKDYDPIPVYCTGILSRGGSLDFVCHDDRQNLQFFQYAPGDPAARGGNKLVCRADFHLGSQTTDMPNHFCRSSLLINSATPSSTLAALKQQDTFYGKADDDQRLAITFGTTDGGFGSIVPLSEPIYWRLTALQSVLVNALESDCALSHRAWRLYRRTPRRGGCRNNERKKGVIDGDVIMQYTDLSRADQEDLASAIGSTVELILDNLLELRCSAMII